MRQVPLLLALLGVAAVTGCAVAGRSQPPTHAAEPGTRPEDAYKSKGPEPETIAGWEARIQRHGAALFATVHTGGVAGGGGGSSTSGGATTSPVAPGPPPPTGPGPSPRPGTAPARRATAARPTARYRRHPTRRAAPYRASIRCRRICRHVRAICYAAQRICQIAARVGGESARAACERNRKRCTSARAITIRQGCTGCGHANRTKKSTLRRRACLR